jgi:hypothetical protein
MLDWKDPLPLDGVVDRGLAIFNATLPRTLGFAVVAAFASNLLMQMLLGEHEEEIAGLVKSGDLAALFDRFGGELALIGVVFFLFGCAVLRMVGALARGVPGDAVSTLGDTLRRAPHLLLASLLFTLACWAGLMLLIVPGIFLMVALSFFSQAVLFDGHDGARALGASFRLTRGRWWRTFTFYLLVLLANLIALMLVGLVLGLVFGVLNALGLGTGHQVVDLFIGSALGALIGLATDAVLVAYYYDLTVRAGAVPRRDPGSLAV